MTQIRGDRVKAGLARCSGALLLFLRTRGHTIQRRKVLVIIRIDGIGDTVLFSGYLRCVRRFFPSHHIIMIVRSYCEELLRYNPYLDEVIPWDHERSTGMAGVFYQSDFLLRIRKIAPEVVVYPMWSRTWQGDEMVSALRPQVLYMFENGRPVRGRAGRQTFVATVASQVVWEPDRYAILLSLIGKESVPPSVPELHCSQKERKEISEILAQQKEGFLVVVPGSMARIKQWPVENWRKFVGQILTCSALNCVLVGGRREADLCATIAAGFDRRRVMNLSGGLELTQLIALFERSEFCVGGDTGLSHVAAAVGTNVVCITGGGHFGRFFPFGPKGNVTIVNKAMDCYGCEWKCLFDSPYCIEDITISDVIAATERTTGLCLGI